MKHKLATLVFTLLFAHNATAQVTLQGYSDVISTNVRASFPASTMLNQALGQVTQAIGNNGNATVTGRDASNNLVGNGLTASTTASANFDIGAGLSTNVEWYATIAWRTIEGGDGGLHIEITVTWGSNSQSYTRVIDAPTTVPNAIWPTNAPPSGGGGSGGSGHFILQQRFGQYSYFSANGTMHIVAYTYYAWVWVETGGGGGYEY